MDKAQTCLTPAAVSEHAEEWGLLLTRRLAYMSPLTEKHLIPWTEHVYAHLQVEARAYLQKSSFPQASLPLQT